MFVYTLFSCVFWNFLEAVHFMLVGLLSSDSYQSIFLLWAFLIYSIWRKTHLITVKRWNCQVSVHKCTDKGKFAKKKKIVTSLITLNIKQIHFSGRDLLLLHSFFSKLLKLLKMMLCLVSSFHPTSDCTCIQYFPFFYCDLFLWWLWVI